MQGFLVVAIAAFSCHETALLMVGERGKPGVNDLFLRLAGMGLLYTHLLHQAQVPALAGGRQQVAQRGVLPPLKGVGQLTGKRGVADINGEGCAGGGVNHVQGMK